LDTKKLIFLNRFSFNLKTHGGSRRDAQIYEIFANFNLETKDKLVEEIKYNSVIKKAISKIWPVEQIMELTKKKVAFATEYKFWQKDFREDIFKRKKVAYKLISIIKKKFKMGTVIFDDPIYYYPLLKYLKKNNFKVIGCMQNLESLVPGNFIPATQKELLIRELKILSLCDLVITISREEDFLLKNIGIRTLFLQYYPCNEILEQLKSLRLLREKTEKRNLLLLGSASNKPTLFGMIKAIEVWQEYQLHKDLGNLIVAGYGTEELKNHCEVEGIKLIGTLDDNHLIEILSKVKAIICYQEKGSGTLTRIMEMLIGNVPVLANRHAVRSYYGFKGIFEFTSFDEFKDPKKINQFMKQKIPVPLPPDCSVLISAYKKLIENGNY
jgi:hypothetical protein